MFNTVVFWGLLAFIFLAIELYTLSLIFLIASVAAVSVCVAHLLGMGNIMTTFFTQIAFFSGFCFIYTLLIYKPLKRYIESTSDRGNYQNIVGHEAVCVGDLQAGKKGQISWSGTLCNAQLVEGDAKDGETVKITKIKGNIFMVMKLKEEDK